MEVQNEITIEDASGGKSVGTISGESRVWRANGFRRTECTLVLQYGGLELRGIGRDYFDAFCRIREQLAERQLIPLCYGASRRVYPSGMQRDMGGGLKAYRLEMGRATRNEDRIGIFETGPDGEPATVAEQKAFADSWFGQFKTKAKS
jgi:hypothetical protein